MNACGRGRREELLSGGARRFNGERNREGVTERARESDNEDGKKINISRSVCRH